jgi:two-component system, LytTR family, response regulator
MKISLRNLKTILIDDEPDARINLRLFLKSYPEITVVADADTVLNGVAAIKKHKPDLIFLDIQMGQETGFDLLQHFPKPDFKTIFCTGFDHFALQAIKNNALDYIVKPIDPDDLALAIQKAFNHHLPKTSPRLAFQTGGETYLIEMDKICHIESDGMYATVQLSDGRRFVQIRSLREFEAVLPENLFFRTHQSHIVNLNFIEKFSSENFLLKMKNGPQIPVARRRRIEMTTALGLTN